MNGPTFWNTNELSTSYYHLKDIQRAKFKFLVQKNKELMSLEEWQKKSFVYKYPSDIVNGQRLLPVPWKMNDFGKFKLCWLSSVC